MWWLVGGAVAIVLFLAVALASKRAPPLDLPHTRHRLATRLSRLRPGLLLGPLQDGVATVGVGDHRTSIENLHARLIAASTARERDGILDGWARSLLEIEDAVEPTREAVRTVFVSADFPRAAAEQGVEVIVRDVPALGLLVSYVLDRPASMAYVRPVDMRGFGLDESALHELAMANLAATAPIEGVLDGVRARSLVRVAAMDGYDAARLLLVPGALRDDETIAAVIPDRDTLALMPVPSDWRSLDGLARKPLSDRVLLDRPVLVSRSGFQVM